MLNKVTITGADDSVDIANLIDLQKSFPFVEWGILVMPSRFGSPRFPSRMFIEKLGQVESRLDLSLHICGNFLRNLFMGDDTLFNQIGWQMFDRFQLNTHGEPHDYNEEFFQVLKKYNRKEFIFQFDGVNEAILRAAKATSVNASALFDLSHGNGILPAQWPDALIDIKCGYAGGLGPENLRGQIEKILEKTTGRNFWIDMETMVRSDHNKLFDISKVEACLKIASEFITNNRGEAILTPGQY